MKTKTHARIRFIVFSTAFYALLVPCRALAWPNALTTGQCLRLVKIESPGSTAKAVPPGLDYQRAGSRRGATLRS